MKYILIVLMIASCSQPSAEIKPEAIKTEPYIPIDYVVVYGDTIKKSDIPKLSIEYWGKSNRMALAGNDSACYYWDLFQAVGGIPIEQRKIKEGCETYKHYGYEKQD